MSTSENGMENSSPSGSTDTPDDIDNAVQAADHLYQNGLSAGKNKALEYIAYEMEYGEFRDSPEVQQSLTNVYEKLVTLSADGGN